jgi:hypothetical protein
MVRSGFGRGIGSMFTAASFAAATLAAGTLAAGALGCGASVSSAGHGSGSRGGGGSPPPPHSGGLSKGELLAGELLTAGAATALEAAMKECPSMCIAPAACDRRTGLCKTEEVTPTAAPPSGKLKLEPVLPVEVAPTCDGLCLPGERCVLTNGKQDCVPLDKLPR